MITIAYNNSNVTIYRIPIRDSKTELFVLPRLSDPQAFLYSIDWFDPNTMTTKKYSDQKFLSWLGATILLIIWLLILIILNLIVLIARQRRRQQEPGHGRPYQRPSSTVCVNDDPVQNRGTGSMTIEIDTEVDDDHHGTSAVTLIKGKDDGDGIDQRRVQVIIMRRLQRLNLNRDPRVSSSDDDNDNDRNKGGRLSITTVRDSTTTQTKAHGETTPVSLSQTAPSTTVTTTTTLSSIQPAAISLMPPVTSATGSLEEKNRRLSLLPAYPSFDQSDALHKQDHLLLANVSRECLTKEQRCRFRERDNFQASFHMQDRFTDQNYRHSSFFLTQYRRLFVDLSRRLHINDAVIDYNYQRLVQCFEIMTNERIHYGLQQHPLANGDLLPIHEYAMALEFFLQIDRDCFFMKTCSFRGAVARQSIHFHGFFCLTQPYASYGMAACRKSFCRLCFPPMADPQRSGRSQPMVQFNSAHEHTFVSGYRSILNCPATCETKNILYALTCPCGNYDYIGYTSLRLDQRLAYHRQHGNRIIHEFILGSKNILRVQTQPKSQETLVKDDMLLYKHSARCPAAMQLFLDCNPQYWPLVPMLQGEAQQDNQSYQMPDSIPADPTSHSLGPSRARSDHEAGCCMTDLPPLPSSDYTFSTRQCAEQFLYFKNNHDSRWPHCNLDLYQATIIAVLPDHCSTPFYRLIEALFITHAQTKLNTLGHLDGNVTPPLNINKSRATDAELIVDRGDWCRDLLRRPQPPSAPQGLRH